MSKNTSATVTKRAMTTRTLTVCALMAALSVVLARLFGMMPNESTRFSLEHIPLFIAGMLCGPLAGGLVGFAADAVGCLFSGYGYNPIFCVPAILYGVAGGVFRLLYAKSGRKPGLLGFGIAFLPPVVLGSILYQSTALAWVYGAEGASFWANFIEKLTTRGIQFAVIFVLDVLCVWLLCKANVFTATKLWPPVKSKEQEGK